MAMLQEDADTLERLKAKWQPGNRHVHAATWPHSRMTWLTQPLLSCAAKTAADRAGSCQAIGEQPGSQGTSL